MVDSVWVPVTAHQEVGVRTLAARQEVVRAATTNSSLPFLDQEEAGVEEPVEVIVSRVLYALLISASLVTNLLLAIAILRLKGRVAVVYLLIAAMVVPDCIFYNTLLQTDI